jgi:aspartyl/asparaginyl beta-hydroxylase (cupin superfamily)
VIVSNDADLAESPRLVKVQIRKVIGLVTRGAPQRKTSRQLNRHADFAKPIRTWMLRSSQLPKPILDTPTHKPAGW